MEAIPVVEIVQVDRITRFSVWKPYGVENFLARFILVNVACDGGIKFGDRLSIDGGAIFFDPVLGLDVSGLGSDEG